MEFPTNPDIWTYIAALIVSIMSGFISVSNRILKGHLVTTLWLVSEMLTAVLCGYLMFESYLKVTDILPNWVTPPVAIALAAYTGGRLFQLVETKLYDVGGKFFDRRDPP